ncbi:class I SAM-dependent methyltransferase [Jannaschia sp. W003]|uniref:class I SAM-dependent DNA methyltransferase n=1 Tax=Jannaschia sp. W003 TaxID=2867012 RepID=UPI0021A79C26|nr:methyltransferase domain-containing protein [Jannaschia sp. W003]UWQ20246.1 methyltransferase domain-containing protein [Jannaschia sp. W003]
MTGLPENLWSEGRSEAELRALYDGWADRYDADMAAGGMLGPARSAEMMARFVDPKAPVLDFGCGTGASGAALWAEGFRKIHGVDLSAGMLEKARERGCYASLTLSEPGAPVTVPEGVQGVNACGSISVGAAPPHVLTDLLRTMSPGAVLVATFNQDALRSRAYMHALADVQVDGLAVLERAEWGPQLRDLGRFATVLALRRA